MNLEIKLDEMAQDIAMRALDEATYEGKTLREWIDLIRIYTKGKGDLISRSALIEILSRNSITSIVTVQDKTILQHIEDAPALDVQPVVHARWKIDCDVHVDYYGETDEDYFIECPICGRKEYNIPTFKAMDGNYEETTKDYPYCHCGARMDGDAHDSGQTPDVDIK